MKLVTAEQMRELDRRVINEWGTPGEVLMERAGKGVADVVRRTVEVSGFVTPSIQLVAGRGNNGGDAFVAARHLKEMSFHPEVWLCSTANQVKGDALIHLSRMKAAGVPLRELPTKDDWDEALDTSSTIDILVDGVLGTGSKGPARGPAVGAIQYINALSEDTFVLSIDIPSGLDADTGIKEGDAVKADITVTMGLPKIGVVTPSALDFVGSVDVIDIGIPDEFLQDMELDSTTEMIHINDLKSLFPRRSRDSHKGNYGHVLLMGGAKGFSGAIAMSARTAIRSGVGLVTVVTPASIAPVVAAANLECMVAYSAETNRGFAQYR